MEALARVVWCLLLAVSSCDSSQPDPTQLFLDSPAHCGEVYDVTNTSVYQVTTNVSKTNASVDFSECIMIFVSTKPADHLCILRREFNITACDVTVTLYDGVVNGVSSDTLTLDCSFLLPTVEWCTSVKPSLSVSVAADGPNPSMSDLDVDLLVYSQQSVHRHVSMDADAFCDGEFFLNKGRINVTNIDPRHSKTKRTNSRPKEDCSLLFDSDGENSFLCVEFHSVRAANPMCTTPNYTLQIYIEQDVVGVRSCQNPEPIKWCSNSTEITLRLLRHGTPEAEEVVFYALVIDQAGPFFDCFFCTTTTAEPSLSTVTMARGSDTSSASSDETTATDETTESSILTTVLGAAGCVVVLALVLVHCLLWRRKPSHSSTDNRKGSTKRKASANRKTSAIPTAANDNTATLTATNDKPTASVTTAVSNAPLTAETAGESSIQTGPVTAQSGDSLYSTATDTSEADEMTESSIGDNTSPVV